MDKIRNSAAKIEDLGKAIEKMENLGMDTTQAKQQLAALKDAMAVDAKKVEAMLTDEKAVLHDMAQLADGTKSLAQWIPEVRVALQAKGVAGTVSDQLAAQAVSVTDSDLITQLITDPLMQIIPFFMCIDVKKSPCSSLQDLLKEIEEKEQMLDDLKGKQKRLQDKTGVILPDAETKRLAAELDKLHALAEEKQDKIRSMMAPPGSNSTPGSNVEEALFSATSQSLMGQSKDAKYLPDGTPIELQETVSTMEGKLFDKYGRPVVVRPNGNEASASLPGQNADGTVGERSETIFDIEGKVTTPEKSGYQRALEQEYFRDRPGNGESLGDSTSPGKKGSLPSLGKGTSAPVSQWTNEEGESVYDIEGKTRQPGMQMAADELLRDRIPENGSAPLGIRSDRDMYSPGKEGVKPTSGGYDSSVIGGDERGLGRRSSKPDSPQRKTWHATLGMDDFNNGEDGSGVPFVTLDELQASDVWGGLAYPQKLGATDSQPSRLSALPTRPTEYQVTCAVLLV